LSIEQIQPLVKQIIRGMLNAGEPGMGDLAHLPGTHEGGTPIEPLEPGEGAKPNGKASPGPGAPPIPGAMLAPDGNHYLKVGGQHYRVEQPATAQ
jgi:hypothetical protein